jgi:terminase large subunit-like protein
MSLGRSATVKYHPSVKLKAAAELELRRRASSAGVGVGVLPDAPEAWLHVLFPSYVAHPFAERHDDLWSWGWDVRKGEDVDPFVGCWGRGGAKSTSAELVTVRWGAIKARSYGLYLCNTQEQADDHISTIGTLLETPAIAAHYPHLADRMVGKYGQSKGWRRNRLRARDGFTIDALGLDSAARGAKLDDQRPDFLIIDDVDDVEDSEATTAKKVRMLTRKILPALTHDAAILFIQNKVFDDGLMAQVLDGRADFLGGAIISGPFPAIDGLEYKGSGTNAVITAGVATWEGQSIEACQAFIRKWGLDAFLSECQHVSVGRTGRFIPDIGMWDACKVDLPSLGRHTPVILALDAGESSDNFARVLIGRHPFVASGVAAFDPFAYVPEDGEPLDFDEIEIDVRELARHRAIQQLIYDPFLLGQFIRRLSQPARLARKTTPTLFVDYPPFPAPMIPFPQGQARLESDKGLYDLIAERRFGHDGNEQLRAHIDNANVKKSADGRQWRIVKRRHAAKIDLAVASGMGAAAAAALLNISVTVHTPPRTPNRFKEL